jgi:hypothetical protein
MPHQALRFPARALLLLALALLPWLAHARQEALHPPISFQHFEVPAYTLHERHAAQTVLKMNYASAVIKEPRLWTNDIRKKEVYEVDFVFTNYPSNKADWLTHYDTLLNRRLRSLMELIPELASDTAIRWNMVLQTACPDEPAAQAMFHGAVVKYRLVLTQRLKRTLQQVKSIVEGKTAFADSAVFRTFERHPEWRGMLVVNDWTGSMYDYGAQAVRWHRIHLRTDPRIRHFVFFNDGNLLPDDLKHVGCTGGAYYTEADSLSKISRTMQEVMLSGYGGDDPENDIEAILFGLKQAPDCQEVVLVADNRSAVRDLALLPQIGRPVHVILCGVDSAGAIHEDYLEVARQTGGSIHTIEDDIDQLSATPEEGSVLMLRGAAYRFSGGRWRLFLTEKND